MNLPPFKVWPQLALVWDPSYRDTGVINQMGFFSLSLGPLAIEIDGREYVKWMTDVILPEARMMREMNEIVDGYVHSADCVCMKPNED
jgi:hypothetical protein